MLNLQLLSTFLGKCLVVCYLLHDFGHGRAKAILQLCEGRFGIFNGVVKYRCTQDIYVTSLPSTMLFWSLFQLLP